MPDPREPADEPDHVERTTVEGRAGEAPHVVRFVLMASLALVIAAFAAILLGYMRF